MSFPIENLAEEFDRLADDSDAPHSTVDVERALANGRRAVRSRRSALGVGTGATLAAGLAAVLTFTGFSPGPSGNRMTAPPASSDPMTVHTEFGWLPSGLPSVDYYFNRELPGQPKLTITASASHDTGSSTMRRNITLSVDAARPDLSGLVPAGTAMADVGTIDGHQVSMHTQTIDVSTYRAYEDPIDPKTCRAAPAPAEIPSLQQSGVTSAGTVILLWQDAAGEWLELAFDYVNEPAPDAATMLHIASTVTFGTKEIPMPFSVGGLSSMRVVGSSSGPADGYPGPNPSVVLVEGRTAVSIMVGPAANPLTDNCTDSLPQGSSQAIETINGLSFWVVVSSPDTSTGAPSTVPPDSAKYGTAGQILDRLTSYGADPAGWTTNVLPK